MKKWQLWVGSIIILITGLSSFIAYNINEVPLTPFISSVEASQEDFIILKSSLGAFMHHIKPPADGNYPITINFEHFGEEDKDNLGYALVDNNSCEIFLSLKEKWTREKFNLTLYHELGHCFGLEHDDPAAIMEADYNDPKKELKSLPIFWKSVKNSHRELLVMNSGWAIFDIPINKVIDWWIPETKDSLKRVTKQKSKKAPVKYQHNPSKKMQYQEK